MKIKLILFISLFFTGCSFSAERINFNQDDIVSVAIGDVHTLELQGHTLSSLPAGAPTVDPKQAELGRLLFWDPVLSGNRDVACATCHLPEHGYTDGQHQSAGVGGVGRGSDRASGHLGRVARNAPTVLNTAWNGIDEQGVFDPATAPMFWDNRTASLAAQAAEPIKSFEEMRGGSYEMVDILAEMESRLNNIPSYQIAFSDVFGDSTITFERVASAITSFQTTLVANNSPFDRWMRGEVGAMSPRQISGMQEFAIAGCARCHSGPLFSDFEPHVLGVAEGSDVLIPDQGAGDFAFRTPTLRQLAYTAPYFHAGQMSRLDEVMDFYDRPTRSSNPNVPTSALDTDLTRIPGMERGRGDLIAEFLEALNDNSFDQSEPDSVPSGLVPGGFRPKTGATELRNRLGASRKMG